MTHYSEMNRKIEPMILKGFRDALPQEEAKRLLLISLLHKTFTLAGYEPIDTPCLEYSEILLGKGGGETDKQIFRFKDNGDRDVALRFDLTVPFARFIAMHVDSLYLPFRRYHIAKVWRGENSQRGRFREFYQCDFDIVGSDSASSDAEILCLVADSMAALHISDYSIQINHRSLLSSILEKMHLSQKAKIIVGIVDKKDKIKTEEFLSYLESEIGKQAADLMDVLSPLGSNTNILLKLETVIGQNQEIERLRTILSICESLGISDKICINPTITRGLDYYTGMVFETFLANSSTPDAKSVGSICSGGRYDELASLYTSKKIQGVGGSIGLDRLLAIYTFMVESPKLTVLILYLDSTLLALYHRLAAYIRAAGIIVEIYPDNKKITAQLSYAVKKNITYAIIIGNDEILARKVQIKNLLTRESTSIPTALKSEIDFYEITNYLQRKT